MATSNTTLQLAGLDFDTIRSGLVQYMRGRTEFLDFDFTDSAVGTLLDLLSYNAYMLAFYANMSATEAFLDTAQFYENVVSRAKAIGYKPRSAQGPSANVLVNFTTAVANATFRVLTVARNTKFRTTVNGASYTFTTPRAFSIEANSSNRFFGYLEIVEGEPLTHRFAYTSTNTTFVLPNANVDSRSISVTVTGGGNTQTYVEVSDLRTTNSSSRVFFVEADRNKRYAVSFGDGIMTARPPYNSVVSIDYRVCNGSRANGANTFSAIGSIAGQSSFTLRTAERATGGADVESIESIRFNAPRLNETQNRAVTANDYKRLVIRDNQDLAAVNAWGGEDNEPPVYGKLYLSVKPKNGTLISTSRKTRLVNSLRAYNMQSIGVEVVDPTYLYVIPQVEVRYDPRETNRTPSELASLVASGIIEYESANLGTFEGKFRLSKMLTVIDGIDDSITGTRALISLRKNFVPSTTIRNTYVVNYNQELQGLGSNAVIGVDDTFGWVTSNAFVHSGFTAFIEDSGFGILRIYYKSSNARVYLDKTAGTINYSTGKLTFTDFLPEQLPDGNVQVTVRPESPNIDPIRNQILLIAGSTAAIIDDTNGSVVARVNSVSTVGQTASIVSSTSITAF